MIRAKMRLLEKTERYDGTTAFRFLPVKRVKDGKGLDNENNSFWRYTPTGELLVGYVRDRAPQFELGAYYYVDLEIDEKGFWRYERSERNSDYVNVGFAGAWDSGGDIAPGASSLKMSLGGEAVAAKTQLEPGFNKRWSLVLSLAEPNDGSP